MADIERVNVAGQVYDIRVPDGSSLSLSSLNVTGTISGANLNLGSGTITAGTANLTAVNCTGVTCSGQITAPSVSATTVSASTVSASITETSLISIPPGASGAEPAELNIAPAPGKLYTFDEQLLTFSNTSLGIFMHRLKLEPADPSLHPIIYFSYFTSTPFRSGKITSLSALMDDIEDKGFKDLDLITSCFNWAVVGTLASSYSKIVGLYKASSSTFSLGYDTSATKPTSFLAINSINYPYVTEMGPVVTLDGQVWYR